MKLFLLLFGTAAAENRNSLCMAILFSVTIHS
jgi:hypothetical protein